MADRSDSEASGHANASALSLPADSDTRFYSDYILFPTKYGQFQLTPLMAPTSGRPGAQGLCDVLGAERVKKLTLSRRQAPVRMQFSLGSPEQRVYLFAAVRKGKDEIVTFRVQHVVTFSCHFHLSMLLQTPVTRRLSPF